MSRTKEDLSGEEELERCKRALRAILATALSQRLESENPRVRQKSARLLERLGEATSAIAEAWTEEGGSRYAPGGVPEMHIARSTKQGEEMPTTTTQEMKADTEPATKPAHEIRLGRIKATIWANEGENGPWFNVKVVRLYKDGEAWKSAASYSREDLPLVAKVADMAHTWILQQSQE